MCNAAPCPPNPSTCRCREPLVDKARPKTCYWCGLPVPRHGAAKLDAIVKPVKEA